MRARFSRPVVPGARLTVSAWVEGEAARFQTTDDTGAIVIDRGELAFQGGS